jgi:formylglycine-generating enzyme required for sulfatase activity
LGDAHSPVRLAVSESAVLRRRLQYAWEEISHLTQALKQARGMDPQVRDGPNDGIESLRGEVETLRQALGQKSAELDNGAAERQRLESRLRELEAAHDPVSAKADPTNDQARTLRPVVTQLRHRRHIAALPPGGNEVEHHRPETGLDGPTAVLEEPQHQLKPEVLEATAASGVGPSLSSGEAGQAAHAGALVTAPALNPSPMEPVPTGGPGHAAAATPLPALVESAGGLSDAPVQTPVSRTVDWPWPVQLRTPLLWALPVLLVSTAVLWPWYGRDRGSDATTPGKAPAHVVTGPPPVGQVAARGLPADQADAGGRSGVSDSPKAATSPPRRVIRDRLRGGGLGPEMIAVGPGAFTMGSSAILAHPDEWPPRGVAVGRFLIGTREVTFSEYDLYARSTGARLPDDFDWGRSRRPVVDVSWADAQTYTQWLSRQTGHRYRLPSEAEWEYAARGGSAKSYWWGYERGGGRAVCFNCGTRWDNWMTAPVASLAPNAFGLYDTAGNAMEWVGDCWNPEYTGAPAGAGTRTDGDCGFRVARGGAFNKPALAMRSAARHHFTPGTRIDMLGFRVVRED